MTTSHDGAVPVIPDFEKDAQTIAAYEEARLRFQRREANDAERRTRADFAKKRDAIRAEIKAAASLREERRVKADKALKTYARRYPKRFERNKPLKPSVWESMLSFGTAGRMYNRAVTAAADAVAAQTLRRRKEHDEEELEQQLKRALHLQEDAVKKKLASPEGIAAFHAHPGVGIQYKLVAEIQAERAAFAARLENGDVPPQEQRDREFVERKIRRLEPPFAGVTIVLVARYGSLSYFILRDLERKLYHVTYDPRLEPLIENTFDVYRLADSYEARLSKGTDGRPLPVSEHFARNFKDEEFARAEYRRARAALRLPRTDLAPMPPTDANEAQLLELLAMFARAIGSIASAAHVGAVPPAPDALVTGETPAAEDLPA